MSLGEKLVRLRGDRTQREVAEACGISTSALTMYETGRRVPRDEIKAALARYFSVTIGYLFFNEE